MASTKVWGSARCLIMPRIYRRRAGESSILLPSGSSQNSRVPRLRRVPEDDAAGGQRARLLQREVLARAARLEERNAGAKHDRRHADTELVEEAAAHERVAEPGAPQHEQVLAFAPLQLRDLVGRVATDEARVLPGRRVERAREHHLRGVVHEVRDRAGGRGPVAGHPLVRCAAEEQGADLLDLLERELLQLVTPRRVVELEVPGRTALEVAVERLEIPHYEPAHRQRPSRIRVAT